MFMHGDCVVWHASAEAKERRECARCSAVFPRSPCRYSSCATLLLCPRADLPMMYLLACLGMTRLNHNHHKPRMVASLSVKLVHSVGTRATPPVSEALVSSEQCKFSSKVTMALKTCLRVWTFDAVPGPLRESSQIWGHYRHSFS